MDGRAARACWLLAYATLSRRVAAARPEYDASGCDGPRVLLFWPVDSSPRTVGQVKRNTAHAKSSLGTCAEVFLAHYKGDGQPFGQDWYSENVVGNMSGTGYKFKFMLEAYHKALLEEKWETKYDYVWALDTDIDLTGTDLVQLFRLVKQSKALITGPTFIGSGVNLEYHKGASFQQLSEVRGRNSFLEVAHGDSLSLWRFQRPDPHCEYRHTDFVELTAPILSKMAWPMIFNDCQGCIHDESDWGLDMVWCHFLASKAKSRSSCALIDATPVKHLNWKEVSPTAAFHAVNSDMHRKYGRFWTNMKTFSCVSTEPVLAKELKAYGGLRLVRRNQEPSS